MSENEPSRQSVKIPLELVAEASPYMKRKGYKFQGLLLELFEAWLDRQRGGVIDLPVKSSTDRAEWLEDHELLDQVLSSSDEEGKAAIRAMLSVVAKNSKGRKPHSVPKKETRAGIAHHGKASG